MRGPRRRGANAPKPVGPPLLVPGRLYGVRRWSVSRDEGGELRLCGHARERWLTEGKSTWARCLASGGHPAGEAAPAGGCTCGLYATHPWALGYGPWPVGTVANSISPLDVVGIVEAWGRVHLHREGFRAQYARPSVLLLIGTPRASDYGRLVEDLAITHRAGLLEVESPEALEAHCQENGLGIPPGTVESLITETKPEGPRADGSGASRPPSG